MFYKDIFLWDVLVDIPNEDTISLNSHHMCVHHVCHDVCIVHFVLCWPGCLFEKDCVTKM